MLAIIGKKIGMTSCFEHGRLWPCTVVQAGPCVITQIKELARDGLDAVQLAYGTKKVKNTTKPLQGHFQKAKTTPKRKLVECRGFLASYPQKELALGSQILVEDLFEKGELIDVVGSSKGKGFQGVVKRHSFRGVGDRSHGQKNRQRAPGAIGACATPSRVFKGMRMAGRMGGDRVKVKNLRILDIMPKQHLVMLLGAVPWAKNNYIILEK